jgi:hypothetical protein
MNSICKQKNVWLGVRASGLKLSKWSLKINQRLNDCPESGGY